MGLAVSVNCHKAEYSSIRASVKRISDGKKIELMLYTEYGFKESTDFGQPSTDPWMEWVIETSLQPLRHVSFTDFAFALDIDWPMRASEQENTLVIYNEDWEEWVSTPIKVYARKQYTETGASTELGAFQEVAVQTHVVDEGQIEVSPASGEFPQASYIVLALNFGSHQAVYTDHPATDWRGFFAGVVT
jgi:hypothetical protein